MTLIGAANVVALLVLVRLLSGGGEVVADAPNEVVVEASIIPARPVEDDLTYRADLEALELREERAAPSNAESSPSNAEPAPSDEEPAPLVAEPEVAPSTLRSSSGGAVARDRALENRLRTRIADSLASAARATKDTVNARNTTVAVCVRRLGRPGALVALEADRALRPASNMKLVTAAAPLVLLGPDAMLETPFDAGGELDGGVLRGDLVVRAGGDPLFDPSADGRVAHLLAPLVADLRAAGLTRIAGNLVLDEGGYAAPAPGPGWPDASQYWQEHCALAGGFSANAGCLTAVVGATRTGELARAEVHPLHHGLARTGTVRTVALPPLDVRVGVQGVGTRQVVLDGKIPASVPHWTSRFAHPDPVELFGNVLAAALREGGIVLDGQVVRARRPETLRTLATLRTPVISLLGPINTDSNNAVADQLFLALGGRLYGEPTRAGGAKATAAALEKLGVSAKGLVQVDGSGLSRDDRITARQLAALLDAVLAEPGPRADAFLASLAVGGETGTLSARLKEKDVRGRVRAKTGFIGGTSTLSGVIETAAGEWLIFSILIDYPRFGGLNTSHWKPLQDELVKELLSNG